MATDLERLVVQLSADIKGYENALKRAQGTTNRQTRQIERRFDQMNRGIAAGASRLGGVLVGAFAGAASLRGAQQLLDASTRIENALKVAGLTGEDLTRVYDRLFESAQRNAAPLESLVTLYGRAAIVQKELGVSSEELLRFTDNVALALRVAGTDAQSASGALLQLSQALGSGVIRAEEFKSILEGALPIAQAAAAGLEEAGGSVAKLRALIVDGKVSSEAFFRAFEAGAVILQDKVAGAELTVSQAFVRLQNVLVDAAGRFDDGSAASRRLADALSDLSSYISDVDFGPATNTLLDFVEQVGWGVDKLTQLRDAIYDVASSISRFTGGSAIGEWLEEKTGGVITTRGGGARRAEQKGIQSRIDAAFAVVTAPKTGRLGSGGGTANPTVSLDDYPAGGSAGGRSRGGSIAGIERERSAVKDLIADLEFEQSLIGMTAVEREQANAVRQAGAGATEAQQEKIKELVAAIHDEEQAIKAQEEAYRSLQQIGETAINGITTAMADGKIEGEELLSILMQVTRQLLTMENLQGLGNFIGSLLGGGIRLPGTAPIPTPRPAFANGTNYAPGGVALVGERGPELVNLPRGSQVIPNHKIGGGTITLHVMAEEGPMFRPTIRAEAEGVSVKVTQAGITHYDREALPGRVNQIAADPHHVG